MSTIEWLAVCLYCLAAGMAAPFVYFWLDWRRHRGRRYYD